MQLSHKTNATFPRARKAPHARKARLMAAALCISLTSTSMLPVPMPLEIAYAKPKKTKFRDVCKDDQRPFRKIKNYQLDKIAQGALLGSLIGLAAVAVGDAAGRDSSKTDYLKGALAGGAVGGLAGYLQSRAQNAQNREQLQAAIAGDFSKDVDQYSDLSEKLAQLGNCRLDQLDQIEADYSAGVITREEANKRLASVEKWIAKDDKVISKAARRQTETVTSYAQAVAIVDGADAEKAQDGDYVLALYETESQSYMDSYDIEYATERLRADVAANDVQASSERTAYVNATSGANVRSGPSTDFNVVTTVRDGRALKVRDTDVAGWVEVSDGAMTGFMSESLLSGDAGTYARKVAATDKSRPKAIKVRKNRVKPTGYKGRVGNAVARKKSFDSTRLATRSATTARLSSVREGLLL